MAIEKHLLGRIIHKHDIEENWDKATGFIPQQGEIIVYDIDDNYEYERFKIGDGKTTVINLPFQKTNINDLKAVSYDIAQELTDEQKIQARANIGAGTPYSIKIIEATYYANGESTISSTEEEINELIAEGKNVCIDCFIEPEDRTFRFYFSTKTSSGTTLFVNTEVSDGAPELKLLTLIGSTFMIITMPVPLRSLATESKDGLMSTEDKVKLDSVEEGAQVNVQSDLSQTDEAASDYVKGVIRQESLPEGYPYEEVTAIDISGQEFEINGFEEKELTITHNLNIPFELGQVWKVSYNNSSIGKVIEYGSNFEVQEADDGTLYVGDPATNAIPFYVTANEAVISQGFWRMMYVNKLIVTCTSGTVSETTIHPMDEKFLPSSAMTQSDWSVNDENDPAYVKNRTHWEEVRSISMKETSTDINYGVHFGNDKLAELLRKYKETSLIYLGTSDPFPYVYLDGTYTEGSDYCEYKVQWKSVDSGGAQLTIHIDNDGSIIVGYGVTHNNFNSATIEIIGEETIVHTIDHKYIKDMYYEEPIELFNIENAEFVNGEYVCETPFVITDGNTYIVNWDGTEYTCDAYVFEGIPAIGNTSQFGGNGNGEPFAIGYDNVANINFVYGFDDSNDGSTVTHTFSVAEKVVHTINHKYIKDMYYEEVVTTDISGQEYEIIGFDGDSSSQETTVTHGLNIPFALGQVWNVRDGEYEIEVEEAEDGTLYIGNPTVDGTPFYITANEATINGNWQYMKDIRNLNVVCVSGGVSEIVVHTIDEKYLSILKENNKIVFSMDSIISGNEFESSNGKLLGTYRVTVDGVSEDIEFIDDIDYSWAWCSLCHIETWDAGEDGENSWSSGIYFEFPDDEPHSVKIEIPVNVVKEEYLPESVTATPNWNAVEGENGYIENRTHYEGRVLISTFDSSTDKMTPARYYEDTDYFVVVDGVEYITRVQHKHHSTIGLYHSYLGSDAGDIGSVDADPPFSLYTYSSSGYPDLDAEEVELSFNYAGFEDGHTCEVYQYELKQLDEKFLPVTEDDEILEMLMEHDMLLAVTDSDGSILSDENDNILLW